MKKTLNLLFSIEGSDWPPADENVRSNEIVCLSYSDAVITKCRR